MHGHIRHLTYKAEIVGMHQIVFQRHADLLDFNMIHNLHTTIYNE
jgi:hypothetical protein